jgi:hypothetical protein
LNPFAKAIKEISGKRKKTDADYEKMAELEFKGGLYVNEDRVPILPSDGLEATIRSGARKSKEGKLVESGIYCPEDSFILYDGPSDPDELWKDPSFRYSVLVKVGTARVMRCRPIFRRWAAEVTFCYNTEIVNEAQVTRWFEVAGSQCGTFERRPKYGRFTVEFLGEVKAEAA